MRILHVSDLHFNMSWFDWLARAAVNYDLVCIAGDLLDAGQPDTISEQIPAVFAAIGRISTTVAICSGNHDFVGGADVPSALWMHELRLPGVWVDGNSFKIGKRRFLCHSWLSPIPAAGADDIWIIHSPPEGTDTSLANLDDVDLGDFEFAQVCKSGRGPLIALCGHIHEPRSWHAQVGCTLILNPGASFDPQIPAHIVIDLHCGIAARHIPGRKTETIRLPWALSVRTVIRRRTPEEVESLLDLTLSNQRAEGIRMTPQEIEETRLRLRRLLHEQ